MYFLIAWILDSVARSLGAGLFETIKTEGLTNTVDILSFSVIGWALAWIFKMCISSPGIALLLGAIIWGLFQFAKQGITVFKQITPPPQSGNHQSNETIRTIDQTRSRAIRMSFAVVHFAMLLPRLCLHC